MDMSTTPSNERYLDAYRELDALTAWAAQELLTDMPSTAALQALLWDELPRLLDELEVHRTGKAMFATDLSELASRNYVGCRCPGGNHQVGR